MLQSVYGQVTGFVSHGTFYTGEIMSFVVENGGGNFERCPSGMHLARCYRIIDLGTQKSEYMGQTKYLHKIMLGWEIHGTDNAGQPLKMKDGRPFAIFKNYTLSWSEKANLRLDLQSWRGRPFTQNEMQRFDLKDVLGAFCMLNIIERPGKSDGKLYTNVDGVTPVPHAMKYRTVIVDGKEERINILPAPINKDELFNLNQPDMSMFETFSDNLKAKIKSSPEWQKLENKAKASSATPMPAEAPAVTDEDDDIPF